MQENSNLLTKIQTFDSNFVELCLEEKIDDEKLLWEDVNKILKIPGDINDHYIDELWNNISENSKILINNLINMNGLNEDTLLYSKALALDRKHTFFLLRRKKYIFFSPKREKMYNYSHNFSSYYDN